MRLQVVAGGLMCAGLAATAAAGARADEPKAATRPVDASRTRERTCFQTHAGFDPMLNLCSDVAVCYGVEANLPERIAQWKAQGYVCRKWRSMSAGSPPTGRV